MQPNGSAEWPRLHSFVGQRCRFLAAPSHSRQQRLAGPNLVQAPVPARVSAGLSSPRLAITSCLHRGWLVSAQKLLLLQFACTATTAARCLTPRSSRAPTACHAGPAGGTRYIFASRARASHRRCPLNSNVRRHKRRQWFGYHHQIQEAHHAAAGSRCLRQEQEARLRLLPADAGATSRRVGLVARSTPGPKLRGRGPHDPSEVRRTNHHYETAGTKRRNTLQAHLCRHQLGPGSQRNGGNWRFSQARGRSMALSRSCRRRRMGPRGQHCSVQAG